MNARFFAFAVVLTLFESTRVFAGQQFGRDSVYADPGRVSSKPSTAVVSSRPGRSSLYVTDMPAPSKSTVAATIVVKAGRA